MDFNATIDLIIKDLDETRKIIDDLKKYPGVPVLQVELAKSKCKSAAEVIALLKELEYNKQQPVVEILQPESQINPQSQKQKEKENIEITEIINQPDEKISDDDVSFIITPSPAEKKVEQKTSSDKKTESSIIADKYSHLSDRFNEKMGTMKSDDDLSDIMKAKHVANLSEAIGVNDRFLFIREIFDGNKDTYTQAISRLDNVTSISDARAVIMSYTGENKDNEAVKQLLDLVKRKLPLHE